MAPAECSRFLSGNLHCANEVQSWAFSWFQQMLQAYTGVGVSAGVFLGWLDTDGYAMMGALGDRWL